MASLYIKDSETAELAAELAARLGVTKTEVVRDLLRRRRAELGAVPSQSSMLDRMNAWRAENPLPPAVGPAADKAFFDEMWGEDRD
jgi:antitoxin VapB